MVILIQSWIEHICTLDIETLRLLVIQLIVSHVEVVSLCSFCFYNESYWNHAGPQNICFSTNVGQSKVVMELQIYMIEGEMSKSRK